MVNIRLLDILTRTINNVPTISCENNSRNWPNWDAKGVHKLVIRYESGKSVFHTYRSKTPL
jgi:hypothetical protein